MSAFERKAGIGHGNSEALAPDRLSAVPVSHFLFISSRTELIARERLREQHKDEIADRYLPQPKKEKVKHPEKIN
jgi:hypothetical protein